MGRSRPDALAKISAEELVVVVEGLNEIIGT